VIQQKFWQFNHHFSTNFKILAIQSSFFNKFQNVDYNNTENVFSHKLDTVVVLNEKRTYSSISCFKQKRNNSCWIHQFLLWVLIAMIFLWKLLPVKLYLIMIIDGYEKRGQVRFFSFSIPLSWDTPFTEFVLSINLCLLILLNVIIIIIIS
jgi:hypothetical protein